MKGRQHNFLGKKFVVGVSYEGADELVKPKYIFYIKIKILI